MIVAYRRTHSPSHVAWSEGQRPLGAALHSPDEPSELSQWPGHDDSTINIVMGIIIIIIVLVRLSPPPPSSFASINTG